MQVSWQYANGQEVGAIVRILLSTELSGVSYTTVEWLEAKRGIVETRGPLSVWFSFREVSDVVLMSTALWLAHSSACTHDRLCWRYACFDILLLLTQVMYSEVDGVTSCVLYDPNRLMWVRIDGGVGQYRYLFQSTIDDTSDGSEPPLDSEAWDVFNPDGVWVFA